MASIRKYKKKSAKNYSYEYRIRYKDPLTQEFKEKSKRGFKSEKEAMHAAVQEEIRLEKGNEISDESLQSYLEMWLKEYKKGTVAKNTFELHEQNIKNHILPYFKKVLLKDIKPTMYQTFINHLANQKYSRRTIEIIHQTLYNAFEKAIILEKVEKNPCYGVEMKGEKKGKEIKFIESEHISVFLQAAYDYGYIYWLFYKVLIFTGLRKGEAAALQWTDIDFKQEEATININKSLDFKEAPKGNAETIFGDLKNYNSKRIITIDKTLAEHLHLHKQYQEQNKLALKDKYHHDLNLILCRNDGNYMPKSSLFNSFSRILKKAELPDLPIHSTRHTHAVLQLEAGASMKYVQEQLGHGSIQITSDVYSHISKKLKKDGVNNFGAYINKVLS